MQLTQPMLAPFVGGQIEVQNPSEGYLYRGQIATIKVIGSGHEADIKVTMTWMAKAVGNPPLPNRWKNDPTLDYATSLMLFVVIRFGDGRIVLTSEAVGETTVLFPAGGSALDPAKVDGLDLSKLSR